MLGVRNMRNTDNRAEIIAWLESPAGEAWSRTRHAPLTSLVGIKETEFDVCTPYTWECAVLWYPRFDCMPEEFEEAV